MIAEDDDPIAELDAAAFEAAKKAFREYHASWEGSIAKAICVYRDTPLRALEGQE